MICSRSLGGLLGISGYRKTERNGNRRNDVIEYFHITLLVLGGAFAPPGSSSSL